MTFLELEKLCKKRRRFKLLKYFFIFLFVCLLPVVVFFSLKKKKSLNKHKIKVVKIVKKSIKTVKSKNESNKSLPQLKLILDLSAIKLNSETKKPVQNKIVQKPKTFNKNKINNKEKNISKSNFVIEQTVLPSYDTCIKLAEKYYNNKNYKSALIWAKNANIQNKKLPDSWIISAKSLYKMGKKTEALKILQIYYNFNKNSKVKELLKEWNEK